MSIQIISIEASPYPCDYQEENPPPWSYSEQGFKDWVFEVLTDAGKAGNYPQTLDEAREIAECAGYSISINNK